MMMFNADYDDYNQSEHTYDSRLRGLCRYSLIDTEYQVPLDERQIMQKMKLNGTQIKIWNNSLVRVLQL